MTAGALDNEKKALREYRRLYYARGYASWATWINSLHRYADEVDEIWHCLGEDVLYLNLVRARSV